MLHVVAGALFDDHNRVLIAQRPPGKHMAGGWEFPGGKREANETSFAALVRELREELGVTVDAAEPLIAYRYEYPDRPVYLDLWRVTQYRGMPVSVEGQAIKWVAVEDLPNANLLASDLPMIAALQSSV